MADYPADQVKRQFRDSPSAASASCYCALERHTARMGTGVRLECQTHDATCSGYHFTRVFREITFYPHHPRVGALICCVFLAGQATTGIILTDDFADGDKARTKSKKPPAR